MPGGAASRACCASSRSAWAVCQVCSGARRLLAMKGEVRDLRPCADADGQRCSADSSVHVHPRVLELVHTVGVFRAQAVMEPGSAQDGQVDLATVGVADEDMVDRDVLDRTGDIC